MLMYLILPDTERIVIIQKKHAVLTVNICSYPLVTDLKRYKRLWSSGPGFCD